MLSNQNAIFIDRELPCMNSLLRFSPNSPFNLSMRIQQLTPTRFYRRGYRQPLYPTSKPSEDHNSAMNKPFKPLHGLNLSHASLLANRTPPRPSPIQHLQHPPLLILPHPPQVLIRPFQTADLLLHTDRAAVPPPHERADELPSQRLEVALERDEFAVVFDEEGLVLRRLGADRGEELSVLLVLAQQRVVGAHDAGPEGAEEFRLEALLGVAFADDGALQVEELAVDVLEQGEEGGRVGEFGVDAFFEHV